MVNYLLGLQRLEKRFACQEDERLSSEFLVFANLKTALIQSLDDEKRLAGLIGPAEKAERMRVLDRLNRLAIECFGVPFIDLCNVGTESLSPATSCDSGGKKIKILFLAANPLDTTRLRLDEESRAIEESLAKAKFQDRFDIRMHWAVRVRDLQEFLLRHQPDIVHFSGHGGKSSGIILENVTGNSQAVSARALSKLFSVLRDSVRCVVLNACYSEPQARAIAEHIDYVIGMSESIGDESAIAFASAFYQALGFGKDIQTAFDLGCVQIDLESLGEQDIPRLLCKKDPRKIIFLQGMN